MLTIERDGAVEFSVYLPHAQSVEIVGSFIDQEHARVWLNPSEDGWWAVRLRVPLGKHEFSYFVDDRFLMPDYGVGEPKRGPAGQLVSMFMSEACSLPPLGTPRVSPGRDAGVDQGRAGRRRVSTSEPNAPSRTLAAPPAH